MNRSQRKMLLVLSWVIASPALIASIAMIAIIFLEADVTYMLKERLILFFQCLSWAGASLFIGYFIWEGRYKY